MSVNKAKSYYYKGGGKLNCAQAVAVAFKDRFQISDENIEHFATCGSGRAPEGECGAYYAARGILEKNHNDKMGECTELFMARAGSMKCKEIRRLKKLSCMGCVETMAGFLDKVSGNVSCEKPQESSVHGFSLDRQIRIISGGLVVAGIISGWFIHWSFLLLSLFVGCGLIYAGITDSCLMGILLMSLPYNKNCAKRA